MTASVIPSRALKQTSVSQVENASHDQEGGCVLKWWFSSVMGLRPDQMFEQEQGVAGHGHLERYLTTGELPPKHKLMSKAATGAILKGDLPKPGPDLYVELRFDGQAHHYADRRCRCGHLPDVHAGKKHDGECGHLPVSDDSGTDPECTCTSYSPAWIPLDVANTLHVAGLPWEGFIDLAHHRGPRPVILDHKFFTPAREDLYPGEPYKFLKKKSDLIKTVQLPIYVANMRRYWPDATEFEIGHHQVSKTGVDSRMTTTVVTVDEVNARLVEITKTVETMKAAALETDPLAVPFNKRSCDAWSGCPHQSICPRFKEKARPIMTPEEEALIALIPSDPIADTTPNMTAAQLATAAENDAKVAADKAATKRAALMKAQADAAAELAALDAPAPVAPPVQPPPPVRVRAPMVDVGPDGQPITPAAKVLAPDAPPSNPATASEQPKTDAPAATKKKKASAEPPPPPPAFAGERQSDRDATAALNAMAAAKPAPSAEPQALTQVSDNRGAAVADVLESIARLLRAA